MLLYKIELPNMIYIYMYIHVLGAHMLLHKYPNVAVSISEYTMYIAHATKGIYIYMYVYAIRSY